MQKHEEIHRQMHHIVFAPQINEYAYKIGTVR